MGKLGELGALPGFSTSLTALPSHRKGDPGRSCSGKDFNGNSCARGRIRSPRNPGKLRRFPPGMGEPGPAATRGKQRLSRNRDRDLGTARIWDWMGIWEGMRGESSGTDPRSDVPCKCPRPGLEQAEIEEGIPKVWNRMNPIPWTKLPRIWGAGHSNNWDFGKEASGTDFRSGIPRKCPRPSLE